jgi:signal transduction histidine kinase
MLTAPMATLPSPATNSADLLEAELLALESEGTVRRYAAGDVIFSAGEVGDGFHLVLAGRVRISALVGPNATCTLATIGAGDFFGEMAVIDDGPRSATATAEVPTRTCFIERRNVLRLLERQPHFALNIIRKFSARMRSLNQKYVEEIVQAERLATIGRFATAIVHDFKNPLAIIGLATDLACRRDTRPAQRLELRTMVTRQTARMHTMLHELIDYARPGAAPKSLGAVEFTGFLRELVRDAATELAPRQIRLHLVAPRLKLRVRLDPDRLTRVFYNLFSNAADVMPGGGSIEIRIRKAGRELQVDVQDTGPGIAPEIADSLFKPFATYGKPNGTGLGLTVCRRIAEDHGGRIWAHERPRHGARFTLALPLTR